VSAISATASFTMGRARELKRRADTVLEEIFRALFEEIDAAKIRREVDELRASAPDFSSKSHARRLARRTAIRCAAAGAVSGLPGGLIAIGTLGADLAYLVYQQFRLVLGIATIYGHEPSARERFSESLQCLAWASGVGVSKQGIATVLESATVEGGMVAEKIGERAIRERIAKLIPVVGAVSAGVLNYAAVLATARAAIKYYESRVDPIEADEIWAEGDREGA
jgi:hypothetical protein